MPNFGICIGEVTSRNDPEGLCRVKVRIPAVVEPESAWAWPVGLPGAGGARQGRAEVPPEGANVVVAFVQGNLDHPVYWTGPPGAPGGVADTPEDHATDGAQRQAVAEEDQEWKVTRDDRQGSVFFRLLHKASSLALYLDGAADKLYLARQTASQGILRGTDYQQDMSSLLQDFQTHLALLSTHLNTAGTDAALIAIAPSAASALVNAGTAVANLVTQIAASVLTSAASHVSTKAFTE